MAPRYSFVGSLLCLDLVNTEVRRGGAPLDLLGGFADLVDWLVQGEALTAEAGRTALRRWQGREGEAVFREAVALRAAVRAAAARLAAGRAPDAAEIAVLNRVLRSRPASPQLILEGRRYVLRSVPVDSQALQLLVPVAESAAWLLEQGDRKLVRRCGSADCVRWFYDTTRNKRRRWCSMDSCGSRAKAAAYYRRQRARR